MSKEHISEHDRIVSLEEKMVLIEDSILEFNDLQYQKIFFKPLKVPAYPAMFYEISNVIRGEVASGSVNGQCGAEGAAATMDVPDIPGLYQLTVSAASDSCPFVIDGVSNLRNPYDKGPNVGKAGDSHSWTFNRNKMTGDRIGIRCSSGTGSCKFTWSLTRLGHSISPEDDRIVGTIASGVVSGPCTSSRATVDIPTINGDYQLTLNVTGSCSISASSRSLGDKSVSVGNSLSETFRRRGTRRDTITIQCGGKAADGNCVFNWTLTRLSDPI